MRRWSLWRRRISGREVVDLIDLDAPLLDGLAYPACAGFELWLEGEHQRVVALAAVALREAAREEIASGRADEAVGHSRRLVALQPWDENCHELLVRALAQSLATRQVQENMSGLPPSRFSTR